MSGLTGSSISSSIPSGSLVNRASKRYYSVYILMVLMLVYLTSQTDRFVLGLTSYHVSRDLRIGHLTCFYNESNEGTQCGNNNCSDYQTNRDKCLLDEDCSWDYSATSVYYQILAGPAFIVTFAVSSLLTGLLLSVYTLKRTLLLSICALTWSVLTGLSGFCNQYWELLLTRIGLGIFQAACTPLAGSIMSDIFEEKNRGVALGFYSWGVYFGYGLAFASDFIIKSYGWRWGFWSASILSTIVSFLSLLTVREPIRRNDKNNGRLLKKKPYFKILKQVLKSYMQLPLLLLCIGAGLRQGGGLVWAYNAKAYFRKLHCDTTGVGTYLSWVPVVGGTVGVFAGGMISDGLVRRLGTRSRLIVLVTCCFLAAPFLFGTLYLSPPWAFLSLLFSYITGEMWFGVAIAVAMEMVPHEIASSGLALYLFVINIIGGNINLVLPSLQKLTSLQTAMAVLFPGSYLMAGSFFLLAGILLSCRSKRSSSSYEINEKAALIIQDDDDKTNVDLFTESEEISARRRPVTERPLIAMSFTASM
ncbi:PREDICTED: uncharacterized protein LOC100638137 isoform X1 [Amphimedon queenslandica]|uniref:Major facilitator superfamily (MFS) profile domain-containing protein n=1 Tax=Amphimedon queenslandica TaxID=400682 RepID=A0A1X7UH61_AMPQE|nr:PREDICTED: uncharacterized protein LOC100638137 isoform X2 [Amphimedon queenslandica]XP_019854271.1 PREDICTED: uncharacterized protein LOC100638137 isoform X1 [Amphimedon queenslandica]|eukprot:XP_003387988.1 PREDICTED: uncharacterized protein LOC100638137 isoform X2 [Amphimedon queenslandica]